MALLRNFVPRPVYQIFIMVYGGVTAIGASNDPKERLNSRISLDMSRVPLIPKHTAVLRMEQRRAKDLPFQLSRTTIRSFMEPGAMDVSTIQS
jgi:hypothetical protein